MIQQFREVLRLRTAANQSEDREMIDYADYYFHWLLRFAVSQYLRSFFRSSFCPHLYVCYRLFFFKKKVFSYNLCIGKNVNSTLMI